jgi:hypothetical protein
MGNWVSPVKTTDELADLFALVRKAHAYVSVNGGQIVLNVSPGGSTTKISANAHFGTVRSGGELVRVTDGVDG